MPLMYLLRELLERISQKNLSVDLSEDQ